MLIIMQGTLSNMVLFESILEIWRRVFIQLRESRQSLWIGGLENRNKEGYRTELKQVVSEGNFPSRVNDINESWEAVD